MREMSCFCPKKVTLECEFKLPTGNVSAVKLHNFAVNATRRIKIGGFAVWPKSLPAGSQLVGK